MGTTNHSKGILSTSQAGSTTQNSSFDILQSPSASQTLKRPSRQISRPNYAPPPPENEENEENEALPTKRVKKESVASARQAIEVGHLKDDPTVPVYGHFTSNFALKYRLDEAKAHASRIDLGHRLHATFNQVDFLPEYGLVEKEVKENIKKELKSRYPDIQVSNEHETQVPSMSAEKNNHSIIVDETPVGTILEHNSHSQNALFTCDPLEVMKGVDVAIAKTQQLVAQFTVDRTNSKGTVSHLKNEIMKLQQIVKEQQATIREQSQAIERHVSNAEERKGASDQRISELEQEVNDLTERMNGFKAEKLIIDNEVFDKFPIGDENEGLYVSSVCKHVNVEGKDYDDKTVLCVYKKPNMGQETGQMVNIGGLPFQRVLGEDLKEFYVQEVGPQSFFKSEGRDYIRWFIRKEHRATLF
ncbi:hypothetical protein N431DRAFT_477281 [Stipitochalara longipes BDJ]|nr:hypothetical protein N431DRAFT_477281 [Stipitochalara longipes BDJ]